MGMIVEWDDAKDRSNLRKHGIDFATASFVFDDPNALSACERFENGEMRWQTIGLVGSMAVVLVVHTVGFSDDREVIRIVSARRATSSERKRYDSQAQR